MKDKNPFAITFGLKPDNYISRISQTDEIISNFNNSSNNNIYMITGVRGSGKTVMLSYVSSYYENKDDWIVVELLPNLDMLEQFASRLYDKSLKHKLYTKKTFGFSFKGFSFSITGEEPITNILTLLEELVNRVEKKKKKILICVDEAVKNDNVVSFAQTFQYLLRKQYPVYLLMTGLFQNIYELENHKALTFLFRSPKIIIEPLNIKSIAFSYKKLLKIDDEFANKLAKLTKGFAYAYQVLGFLVYEKNYSNIDDDLLSEFDQYLEEIVYNKLWYELSDNDRKVLSCFEHESETIENLMHNSQMKKNIFSTYRDRLIKRGIVISPSYGKLEIILPRFFDFVKYVNS